MSFYKDPESAEFGKIVRNSRRNIGLSQAALSSFLGVTQARVSRWECGREQMPRRHKLSLIDLLSNKSGKIDPLIERLVRHDPSFAVTSGDTFKILRESENVLNAFKLNRSEVDGTAHGRVFSVEWKTRLSFDLDFYLCEYIRDTELAGKAEPGSGKRLRIKMFAVELAGYDRVYVRQNHIIGPSQGVVEADMLDYLKREDLE